MSDAQKNQMSRTSAASYKAASLLVEQVFDLITAPGKGAKSSFEEATLLVQKVIDRLKVQSYQEAGNDEMARRYFELTRREK